ncbi:hypothetical protein ACFYZ9_39995 [Streptomyces sp. NPDC001691]|uniref:hypothetical protein n=1 Tax=Streptomyces sp. NPDC001691 TaxID=3364600 RepID=UPI00369F15B7
MTRVHHDQDVPVTVLLLTDRDQALDHGPQLVSGDCRGIVRGASRTASRACVHDVWRSGVTGCTS